MTWLRRLADFLALKKTIYGLLGMVVLVGMGEHMAERFLPLYLERIAPEATLSLPLGPLQPLVERLLPAARAHLAAGGMLVIPLALVAIGLLAFLDDLLSALYSFPGGYLADRCGTKRALLVFNGVSIAGYLIVIFVWRWWAVLAGAALFISWSALSLPATMALLAKALPKQKRTMGVSVHALIRRVPKMLGPVLGGAFITVWGVAWGVRYAFVAALLLAVAAMVMQQLLIEDDRGDGHERRAEHNPFRLFRKMNPDLRNLLISDILIRFCERIPDVFVVLWCMKVAAAPVTALEFGLLSLIEQVTAVLCYIPVAHLADRFGKKPFVLITFVFFTLFPLVLVFCQSWWPLVGAFVLRGLKEFGEPTRKALIMELAPEEHKAGMFGLYYLIRDLIVSLAALSGAVLWWIGPRTNLLVAFGFGVIGCLWFAFRGRDLGGAAAR